MATQGQEHFSLSDRLKCFSTWHKAKRAVAVCLRFQKKYKGTGSNWHGQLKSGDPDTIVAKEKAKTRGFMSTEPRATRYVHPRPSRGRKGDYQKPSEGGVRE